jgi:short-subunit dehydrogenase
MAARTVMGWLKCCVGGNLDEYSIAELLVECYWRDFSLCAKSLREYPSRLPEKSNAICESTNQPVYSKLWIDYLVPQISFTEDFMTTSGSSDKGTLLITGASTGIGAVYADRFAHRGYDLVLVARNAKLLGELADALATKTGRKVEALVADLTDKADLRRVEERLRSDSSITGLVNNAGFGGTASLVDSKIDELENMIELNVTALTRLTAAVLPGLLERKKGVIINISSIVAVAPELLNGVYSGTKAFVLNLTQSLHKEVKDKGVQVQAVLPGATASEFWDRAGIGGHQNLPKEMVMTSEEMVDASLAGFDRGELVTIPALPEVADWERFDSARVALGPNLSRQHAAARYGVRA